MRHLRALGVVVLTVACMSCAGNEHPNGTVTTSGAEALTGPYLGQSPPGLEPELFAPGVVSTGLHDLSISFSPSGNEVFFFVTGPTWTPRIILHSRLEDGTWSTPREAGFSDPGRTDLYPFVTPDGNRLFFCSYRSPVESVERGSRMEIWVVERTGTGWSEPQKFDFGGDLGARGTYPSVAANGNLYFNGNIDSPSSAIYVSRFENGKYHRPEILGPKVHDEAGDHHPFVAPDESYVLFSSERDAGSFGGGDLFMCLRLDDGTWSEAKNLGPQVNTPFAERSPFVTADGKYLFFSSSRPKADLMVAGRLSYEEVNRQLQSPGNGLQDIYWVSTEALSLP